MIHYSDDELAWHALRPSGDIAAHLAECTDCAARYADIQRFDEDLSSIGTWTEPRNLRNIEDVARSHLREIARRLANETAEAERSLGKLVSNPLPFIWKDVSRKRGFRTAGAVRVLCLAANDACERDPLHALNLADAAVAIAASFSDTEHYLGIKVHQLLGHAWKERANALRYLGRFPAALDALDHAKRAYERADANPFDLAVLLYMRGVVLSRSARADGAEKCADEAAKIFQATGDRVRYLHARMLRATVRYSQQNFASARDDYRQLLIEARQERDDLLAARLSSAAARCELELGNAKSAEADLLDALRVFEHHNMVTEVARLNWALARVPLVEGRFEVAIVKLRTARLEADRLGLATVVAYVTLDLVEALVATDARLPEVQKLCRDVFTTFKASGMVNEALTALAYLREATRARTLTPEKVRRVRRFLIQFEEQPTLRFDPFET
jgi:tetratricopeptide (TPR) repeat protein